MNKEPSRVAHQPETRIPQREVVLRLLKEGGPRTTKELAILTNTRINTIAARLGELEEKGLVTTKFIPTEKYSTWVVVANGEVERMSIIKQSIILSDRISTVIKRAKAMGTTKDLVINLINQNW